MKCGCFLVVFMFSYRWEDGMSLRGSPLASIGYWRSIDLFTVLNHAASPIVVAREIASEMEIIEINSGQWPRKPFLLPTPAPPLPEEALQWSA